MGMEETKKPTPKLKGIVAASGFIKINDEFPESFLLVTRSTFIIFLFSILKK